jgi:hypothetical protein
MANTFTCPNCQQPTPCLYVSGGECCFDCLPAQIVDRYPGWREREAKERTQRERRAEQARKNFNLQPKEAASTTSD